MFQNLKTKNTRQSIWKNQPNAGTYPSEGYCHAPGAVSFSVKGNEADRMVRCRICGFPCDKERDAKARDNTWAGLGVRYSDQKTAGSSIGDVRRPGSSDDQSRVRLTTDDDERITTQEMDERIVTGNSTGQSPDMYYDRTISGGCPACGCLTYYL